MRTADACRRTLLVAITFAAAGSFASAGAQGVSAGDIVAVPQFSDVIDPAAKAARLRPLRTERLAGDARELRIWKGFGLGMPNALYLIRADTRAVTGELVLFWNHAGEGAPEDREEHVESRHAYVRRTFGCGPIRRERDIDVCRPRVLRPQPDWRRILTQLDSLGVGSAKTPPPPPARPCPPSGSSTFCLSEVVLSDGWALVLERLDSHGYQTAHFDHPDSAAAGDLGRVGRMSAVLGRVWEAAIRDTAGPKP